MSSSSQSQSFGVGELNRINSSQKFKRMTADLDYSGSHSMSNSTNLFGAQSMSLTQAYQGTSKFNRMTTYQEEKSQSFSFQDNPKKLQALQQLFDTSALPDYFDEKSVTFNELQLCEICFVKFNSTTNRRHHCRKCGKSVCGKCSANQRSLSKMDEKTLYRICDACDTELQNYTLKKNLDDIIKAQEEQINIFNERVEQMDEEKTKLRFQYEEKKQQLKEKLEKAPHKKAELEKEVEQLGKDLEKLNINRITLHQELCVEERTLKEKEQEKNKLINQKSIKLNDLADKEKILHDKEIKNEEIRKQLEAQKQKFNKSSLLQPADAAAGDEELKNSTLSNNKDPQSNQFQMVDEE